MRQTAFPVGSKTSSKPAGVADRLQLNAMSLLKCSKVLMLVFFAQNICHCRYTAQVPENMNTKFITAAK